MSEKVTPRAEETATQAITEEMGKKEFAPITTQE